MPFLSMGSFFAVFLTDGINTRENDRLNKYDNGLESSSGNFFKRILGILSGPMLRIGLRRVKTFRTINTENVMLLSSLLVTEAKCGVSSLAIVYTEAKYLLKTCVMEKRSVICSPLSSRMQLSLDFESSLLSIYLLKDTLSLEFIRSVSLSMRSFTIACLSDLAEN